MVRTLSLSMGLMTFLYLTYWLKVTLGISLGIGSKHFPCYIQKYSGGIIKCQWFPNGHHCNCD